MVYRACVDIEDLAPDPIEQLRAWFRAAEEAGVVFPEAMTLATATPSGKPSARMVLLRGIDERGLVFFTNTESRKAQELDANPLAALILYWQAASRQVRVEGTVTRVSDEETAAYFATRPRGHRLAAWASPQSRALADRSELERRFAEVEERFSGVEEVTLPPFWGGYRVSPDAVELWESRENRMHDRVLYTRAASGWARVRLAP
jgi:pyridoxamine 5'-phosphate oxidase